MDFSDQIFIEHLLRARSYYCYFQILRYYHDSFLKNSDSNFVYNSKVNVMIATASTYPRKLNMLKTTTTTGNNSNFPKWSF